MIAPADFAPAPSSDRLKSDRLNRAALVREATLHDAGLVSRFKAGDETAFVEIVTRYRERMFTIAFTMLHNRADAEEVAQDTFIRAHRALANFRGDSSLVTWLHRIALNLARNRYWYFFRRGRHATVSLDHALSEDGPATFADLIAADTPSPVREAATDEFTELVAGCMARLAAGPRAILDLRNARNLSYGEIARELGIQIGTVKSRIARAREMLRELLAAACPEFGEHAQPSAWFDPIRPSGRIEVMCA